MPKLYIAEDGKETLYEIVEGELSMGRGAANAVQIQDSHASKQHAVIRRIQGHFKLVDLESKNGTRVNGVFRNQHWLRDGDVVSVGHATLRYAGADGPQGPPVAVPVRPLVVGAAAPPPPPVARPAVPVPPAAPAVVARPAVPVAAAPAAPGPVAAAAPRAALAPASAPQRVAPARRRPLEPTDGEFDDPPPRRRSSNSALVAVGGLLGAGVLALLIFGVLTGGDVTPHNRDVLWQARRLAEQGRTADAIRYAEAHADPGLAYYLDVVDALEQFQRVLREEEALRRNHEAQKYYTDQIYHKQALTSRFRAKFPEPDDEIVRRLREFLWQWRFTPAAHAVLYNEGSEYPDLREAMRERATDAVTPQAALAHSRSELERLEGAGHFGEALRLLAWERDRWKLILTAPRWKDFQVSLDAVADATRARAREHFARDRDEVRRLRSAGDGAGARRRLARMQQAYWGDPELERLVGEVEAELRR